MERADSRTDLPSIDVPAVVICGCEDAATLVFLSKEIAAGVSAARLCVIEECGHITPTERPNVMTALLRD